MLSIPSVLVLYSGDEVGENGGDSSNSIFNLFTKTTLGNIGFRGATSCQYTNLAKNPTKLDMHCPSGVFSRITAVGLTKEVDQDVCAIAAEKKTEVVKPDGTIVSD